MTRHTLKMRSVVLAGLLACAAQVHAQALPQGATVINGTAGINTFSNGMQVINSPGAIIHWDSFSIGNGRTVRFDQLTSQSAVLNRVTGNAHSEILGTLQSNGRVFLLNPNGILFGAGARVDVAGLLASTLNISDADFLAGNYRFSCFNATVCESGVDTLNPFNNRIVLKDGSQITTRTAGEGGQVWLIARDRITSEKGSKIEAPSGQVMAAAAREVTIASPALGNMTFTLTGTAGSRIDLAGDIDVPRGAAGFFADTIRFAGSVRALSDVDAAGQIVARAANEIIVDGDARLDVSGTDGADAGAVRLKAVRQITVHATSETSADSGAPTTQHPSPMGGLIELEAYQVSLPWEVSTAFGDYRYADYGHAALHAFAKGAAVDDFSRYGNVRINEAGTFTFESVTIPLSFSGGQVYDHRTESEISGHSNMESLRTVSRSGNGNLLVVTNLFDDYHANDSTVSIRIRTISPTGAVMSETTLGSSPAAPSTASAIPLSGGGWLVWAGFYAAEGAQGAFTNKAWVINGQGQVVREFVPATDPDAIMLRDSAWSLQGGGFAISTSNGSVATTNVYTPLGLVDPAASLPTALAARVALQNDAHYYSGDGLSGRYVNFNPSLKQRRVYGEDAEGNPSLTQWEIFDSKNGQVVWTSPFQAGAADTEAGMSAVGTTFIPDPAIALSSRNYSSSLGIFNAAGGRIGTLGGFSSEYSGGGVNVSERTVNTIGIPLGSDLLFGVENTNYSTTGLVGGGRQTDSGSSMRFVMAVRRPDAMPVAATQTSGAVAASLLLASAPGSSNGSLGGDGGVVLPPVNPGTPPSPSAASPQDLPPPVHFPGTRPTPKLEGAPSTPMGIPAAITNEGLGDGGGEAALLEAARDVVLDALGPRGLAKFNAADSARERAAVLQEAAYSQAIGPDLYAATEFMGEPMRQTLFNTMADLQKLGVLQDDGLFDGLERALTVKRRSTNADGSTGPSRTPLEVPLMMLEVELAQATTVAERKAIQARAMREMIIAAREEAGETVDDTADVTIVDTGGATVRITEDGKVIRE